MDLLNIIIFKQHISSGETLALETTEFLSKVMPAIWPTVIIIDFSLTSGSVLLLKIENLDAAVQGRFD